MVFNDQDNGLPAWDQVWNMIRHYDVSQYILDHYTPLVDADGTLVMLRSDIMDHAYPLPPLQGPSSTTDLYFDAPTCAWGDIPNFLQVPGEPVAGIGGRNSHLDRDPGVDDGHRLGRRRIASAARPEDHRCRRRPGGGNGCALDRSRRRRPELQERSGAQERVHLVGANRPRIRAVVLAQRRQQCHAVLHRARCRPLRRVAWHRNVAAHLRRRSPPGSRRRSSWVRGKRHVQRAISLVCPRRCQPLVVSLARAHGSPTAFCGGCRCDRQGPRPLARHHLHHSSDGGDASGCPRRELSTMARLPCTPSTSGPQWVAEHAHGIARTLSVKVESHRGADCRIVVPVDLRADEPCGFRLQRSWYPGPVQEGRAGRSGARRPVPGAASPTVSSSWEWKERDGARPRPACVTSACDPSATEPAPEPLARLNDDCWRRSPRSATTSRRSHHARRPECSTTSR